MTKQALDAMIRGLAGPRAALVIAAVDGYLAERTQGEAGVLVEALEAIDTGMCTGSPPSCACRTCIARRALAAYRTSKPTPTAALPACAGSFTRETVAAYLTDRADQIDTKRWEWNPLVDAAKAVINGEVEAADAHGEFDEDLRARVRRWKDMP